MRTISCHHSLFIGLALSILWSGGSPGALAEVGLEVEPLLVIGGAFSGLDPDKSEITVGSTELRVLSTDEDWRLYVTALEPLRRDGDGLELPMQRFRELFPDLPEEIINFQPHKIRERPAGPDWYVLNQDWQPFQEALQDYLQESDPPGTYRSHLRFELLNDEDIPLTGAVDMTIEFDILEGATVELMIREIAIEVRFEGSDAGRGESFLIPVSLRANTSWTLRLRGSEDTSGESRQMPLEMLSARVDINPEDEWQAHLPDFEPLSQSPLTVASGLAPRPFTIVDVIIPLQLACDVPITMPSGSYSARIEVTVSVEDWDAAGAR